MDKLKLLYEKVLCEDDFIQGIDNIQHPVIKWDNESSTYEDRYYFECQRGDITYYGHIHKIVGNKNWVMKLYAETEQTKNLPLTSKLIVQEECLCSQEQAARRVVELLNKQLSDNEKVRFESPDDEEQPDEFMRGLEIIEPTKIKHLPLQDLELVEMVYVFGWGSRVDHIVFNQALKNQATFHDVPKDGYRCDCCGKRLKYICEIVHKPSLIGYFIGRSCARKIDSLQRFAGIIEESSIALAERAACQKREEGFREVHPELAAILDWAKSENATPVAKDMISKLRRWGNLSENQTRYLVSMYNDYSDPNSPGNIHKRQKAEQEQQKAGLVAAGIKCPTGKIEIQGKVVSTKQQEYQGYGYGQGTILTWKMLVAMDNGVRVFGSIPRDSGIDKGDTIKFTATVTPSRDDPLFGFFSRPSKAQIIQKAQV